MDVTVFVCCSAGLHEAITGSSRLGRIDSARVNVATEKDRLRIRCYVNVAGKYSAADYLSLTRANVSAQKKTHGLVRNQEIGNRPSMG